MGEVRDLNPFQAWYTVLTGDLEPAARISVALGVTCNRNSTNRTKEAEPDPGADFKLTVNMILKPARPFFCTVISAFIRYGPRKSIIIDLHTPS